MVECPLPVLHLLVVDEDDAVRSACSTIASKMGFAVMTADGLDAARSLLNHHKVDLILLDLRKDAQQTHDPNASPGAGLALLTEIKTLHPATSVIVMTAFATVSNAVEAMRIGASDYLTKPFALDELMKILDRAAEQRQFDMESRRLRERLRTQRGAGQLVGRSAEMEKLYRILSKVASSAHPVLLIGESGSGKEMAARAIHFNGPIAAKPFVAVDCASLVPSLLEAELFGYSKGAFPGAHRAKEGLLSAAEGGTVFLDEVGELPLEVQAKLLRSLQDRSVMPLGGTHAVPIAVRVLASTSRNLGTMVEQGRFRKDLFFHLNVVNLRLPALRDRQEDIPALAHHFLERIRRETGAVHTLSDDSLRLLVRYEWPGNVRELENVIERACTFSSGPVLHLGDLPTQLQAVRVIQDQTDAADGESRTGAPELDRIVPIAQVEKEAILGTLLHLKGDKLMTAKLLGIGKTTLYRKLKEYGIEE